MVSLQRGCGPGKGLLLFSGVLRCADICRQLMHSCQGLCAWRCLSSVEQSFHAA